MHILLLQCCELPYRFYSPSLHGLVNQVKSIHHTVDHFGSVQYAVLWKKMEIADSLAAVSYQKLFFLTVTQLADLTTVKVQYETFVGQIMFVTTKFQYTGRQ